MTEQKTIHIYRICQTVCSKLYKASFYPYYKLKSKSVHFQTFVVLNLNLFLLTSAMIRAAASEHV